ncbi:MAG: type II secretion system protein GspE, partial [Bacillota bacterium]
KYKAFKEEIKLFKDLKEVEFLYKAKKCNSCRNIGYKGRIAVHEILIINDKIKNMIDRGVSEIELRNYLKARGEKSLEEDALLKVKNGVSSLNEIIRVLEFD